ncbi:MAG: DNA adenine methylase [Solirubrobacteraceae bacterium]
MSAGAAEVEQLPLGLAEEDPRYLTRQLITYIGNKRALLGPIKSAVEDVRRRSGLDRLRILDAFSGSGVVSRMLKQYASELVVNDTEDYARVISQCYLSNRGEAPMDAVAAGVRALNLAVDGGSVPSGFIRRLYAPRDATAIEPEDRVFYTPENAYRLDAYRQLIEDEPPEIRTRVMGPLLSAASIHANTAGVFKGFYKDRNSGIGKFGGSGADALERITAQIRLEPPILSRFECDYSVYQMDANLLVGEVGDFDVAYFDPPYNQHPYGSNYFMLNLLVNYEEPREMSRVSGIPTSWQRSDYNVRGKALPRLRELIHAVDARFVILSFNDDGFISPPEVRQVLNEVGTVTEQQQPYATFRGCRNLRNRSIRVIEHVYLIEKG